MAILVHGSTDGAGPYAERGPVRDEFNGWVKPDDRCAEAGRMMTQLGRGPVRQRIGPTIKIRRHQLAMSLNTLAEEAGISPSHLSRIERGLTVPSYDVLDRIADALGSDLSALRNEEEQARSIDGQLDSLFSQLGLEDSARMELLQLSHETREALAAALLRLASR